MEELELARRPFQLGGHGRADLGLELVEGAGLHHDAVADDADTIGQRLGLGQDVAGEQDTASARLLRGDLLLEDGLHERVEARCRLVEDQQLDVGGQRRDDGHLLAVALGVLPATLGRVELEPLQQVGAALLVQPAAQLAEQVDGLPAGQARPQADVAGHVGKPTVQVHDVAPRVTAEQLNPTRIGLQQPEQHADRR